MRYKIDIIMVKIGWRTFQVLKCEVKYSSLTCALNFEKEKKNLSAKIIVLIRKWILIYIF